MRKRSLAPGDKFNRLTVVEYVAKGRWLFVCECGTQKQIAGSAVKTGAIRSCGCLHMDRCRAGTNRLVHGDARFGAVCRLHSIWRGIINRCTPGNVMAKGYAARGISVCDEWRDYTAFRSWATSSGYGESLTIDRIDVNGNYSPQNCRWVDRKAQARNRRTSRILTVGGISMTVAEWAERKGVAPRLISTRLRRGWPEDRAVNDPAH